jgi:PadR family transcriptional regulator
MDTSRALRELLRGTLEYCVMAMLARRQMYGFELVRTLQTNGLATSMGTIYPLLSRLHRDGMVTTHQQPTAGPSRRYYQLTPAGRQALDQFVAQWHGFRDAVDRLLTTGEINEHQEV